MIKRLSYSACVAAKAACIAFRQSFCDCRDVEWVLGYRDDLTGLLNAKAFNRDSPGKSSSSALVFIDIDSFKQINDTLGHLAGDAVLKRLAMILRRAVAVCGTAYRLHGDEFAAIIREESISEVCAKITEAVGTCEWFTVSIGVARSIRSIGEREIHIADAALYQSKRTGRKTTIIPAVA